MSPYSYLYVAKQLNVTMGKNSYFTDHPVYSQVINLLDKAEIIKISCETVESEAYIKKFDGYQHLIVMLFGVLKHFDSLREQEIGMKDEANKLQHLGLSYLVRRSTLAEPIFAVQKSSLARSM